MYKIISGGEEVTDATSFKESLNRAENARIIGMIEINIKTPTGEIIHYYS